MIFLVYKTSVTPFYTILSVLVLLILTGTQSKPFPEEQGELSASNSTTDPTAEILDLLNSKGFKGNSSQKVLSSETHNKSLLRCLLRSHLSSGPHNNSVPSTTSTTETPLEVPDSFEDSNSTSRPAQLAINRVMRIALKSAPKTKIGDSTTGGMGTLSISSGVGENKCDNGMTYSNYLNKCITTSDRGTGVGK